MKKKAEKVREEHTHGRIRECQHEYVHEHLQVSAQEGVQASAQESAQASAQKSAQASTHRIVLLIDGRCFLCHGVTKFVLKRDPHARFRFATLQSPYGQSVLVKEGIDPGQRDTFLMLDGDRVFMKSDAALRVLKRIGGGWALCYAAIVVPRLIRDAVYQFIARNRYRWFGQSEQCLVPEKGWKERWVEDGWEQ